MTFSVTDAEKPGRICTVISSFQAIHLAVQEQDQQEILAIQQGKAIKTWETKADCHTIGFFPPADDGECFCRAREVLT